MAHKKTINKKINLDELKTKLFSDLQMMKSVKLKGIDSIKNGILISLKTGKTKITTGDTAVEIVSKARLIPLWTWDLILDRTRTKRVHQRITQIVETL
ncbi:hypothetical protein DSCW_01220 [Desulfosarcina widdelii]|uniref:Uncharacterized protein n=1 Tax=Desulfosarcina widdelii TaxID=947919 RepID=A0A5K7YWC7_9BACT|nr:hypothetical protein [Desulfosarcina widdelii]BBO72705.1 hypothetical protein DSCW_01220 [Desulfosarcina widdelii]